jgi:uncharacterized protein (TIGR03437 family)
MCVYLSYLARIAGVTLLFCTDAALAQSSLFAVGGVFPVGSGSVGAVASPAMVVADFNRDGKADIVTANTNDGTLTLLLGDGKGHFTQAPGSPIRVRDTSVQAIATGDFNGDGNPDLVVTGFGTEILLGGGTGGFVKGTGTPTNISLGGSLIAVGDFNGDGKLDLIAWSIGASLLWPGDGTGGFGQPLGSPLNGDAYISSIVTGDFNGDGKLDLAFVEGLRTAGMLSVAAGDGTGRFQPILMAPAFSSAYGVPIAAGDFIGAGKSDLLAFTSYAPLKSLSWLWTGITSPPNPYPFNQVTSPLQGPPAYVVVADFNGDGKLDWAGVDPYSGTVLVALGNGTGAFTPAPGSPYFVGGAPFALAAADFNGDGKVDLAVDTGSNVVLLLNGAPSLTGPPPVVSAVVNGASYVPEPLSANAYAALFGSNLVVSPGDPVIEVSIIDPTGDTNVADVLYAAPGQINIFVPDIISLGHGTLQVSDRFGTSAALAISIANFAPGLFTVDTAGKIPAAQVIVAGATNAQTVDPVASCTGGTCTLVPIVLNPADQTYLILYGTGIRGRASLSDVSVTIGGLPATVSYAGPQGVYPGLDQVNVLIPQALTGSKQVDLDLKILKNAANTVQLLFQ